MSTRPADPAPAGCTAMRLRRTARRVTQIYERHLEPYGLTAAQFGLLAQLRAHAGVSIGALAELMFMDATTLSRNLRPLERRALVAFSRDARDRRARRLKLTDEGRALLKSAAAGWAAAQRQVEARLGVAGAHALNATLDAALERLAE